MTIAIALFKCPKASDKSFVDKDRGGHASSFSLSSCSAARCCSICMRSSSDNSSPCDSSNSTIPQLTQRDVPLLQSVHELRLLAAQIQGSRQITLARSFAKHGSYWLFSLPAMQQTEIVDSFHDVVGMPKFPYSWPIFTFCKLN